MKRKILTLTTLVLLAAGMIVGCSSKSPDRSEVSNNKETSEAKQSSEATKDNQDQQQSERVKEEVREIKVATSGGPKPFTYVLEDEEIKGYDIDVVRAVFEQLPQYKLTFEVTEIDSILAGLDSNLYQIGANHFAMNEARKEKYIYSDPIFQNKYVIAVPKGRDDIKSFADLAGKTTDVSPGTNYALALENYNEENPENQVQINYSDMDLGQVLRNLDDGNLDFILIFKSVLQTYTDEFGLDLDYIELSTEEEALISTPYTYLLLSKGEEGEQLASDVNEALKKLSEDGTLKRLSEEYMNEDYSPK